MADGCGGQSKGWSQGLAKEMHTKGKPCEVVEGVEVLLCGAEV